MRYSFENFKLFCAAHIIRSLHKNEQRAIKFEKRLTKLYNTQKTENIDISFFELLILENTGIIRQTLDNLKNESETFKLKEDDSRLTDFYAFRKANILNEEKKDSLKKIEAAYEIQKKIKNYKKNSEDKPTDFNNDMEINDIVKHITEIVGCNIETGGGILLYNLSFPPFSYKENSRDIYCI
jgi:CRISPR/Cas system-associated endonuclease/helicase Cas3